MAGRRRSYALRPAAKTRVEPQPPKALALMAARAARSVRHVVMIGVKAGYRVVCLPVLFLQCCELPVSSHVLAVCGLVSLP